jgi:hypothetical protein
MKTHLEFRSDSFSPSDDESEVNPGRWGKTLAEHLAVGLSERGFEVGAPYSEDWGWVVPIEGTAIRTFVGCGNYEEYPDGFLVFIEPSRPYVRRLWKKVPTEPVVAPVSEALEHILRGTDQVRGLAWWPSPNGPAHTEVS